MSQRLQLFTSHLSHNNVLTLKVFLGLTKADEVANWEYTDDPDTAAALLIDADSKEGNLQLKDWVLKNKRQVLIAFSNRMEGFPENVLVLPRPLRSAELIPVLRQASKQFLSSFNEKEEQCFSKASRISSLSNEVDVDVEDKPNRVHRVLEVLYKNKNKIIKATDRIARTVIFDLERQRYYTTHFAQMEIEDLIASPVNDMQIEELNYEQLARAIQNLKAQDLDAPLWIAALAISNDQLFDGLSLTGSYRLNRWPNLKKLGQDPLHMKLTALVRRGGTINQFIDLLKAPAEDIIGFINACHVLNYLEHREEPAMLKKMLDSNKQSNASKQSLFSRIRSRLGI